ncbi:host specificity protein J [Cronobacter turicensis]|uniref:host specificity protein J n=1 Tax=Cronobacter turicensis TaxID=413502 RepID=UPI0024C2BBA8|nr:host specificity protein J [Cronobacter turicensis]MDK1233709.1 host specificity protein J [Cronobacter turicensis]
MEKITGKKGGSSNARTPKESPDSLLSIATAKILLALGEGEFAGGLSDKDIFLDGTPIRSADGTLNFPGVKWEFRPGTQAQDYIPGLPAVENEITINTPLKATQPWTRAISNTQLSAVRVRFGFPSFQRMKDNGDVVGYRVEYKIELSTDGGGYVTVLNGAFDGKTTSLYERSHRIDLPPARTGWQLRVSRTTPDSTSSRIVDTTNIEAYSEIIDAKLRYPNTALIFVSFDAKQFNAIPRISVRARGRQIRVPTTYDPVTRTYSGTWDGSFKWAWSNNPAWVFYDLVLSDRFGIGVRLDATQVDKWELYRIAQYCDQPVPDGTGGSGTEPRFICDVYIQSQNEAFTVLRDLASIFRGMTYWGGDQLFALADMPRDMTYVYTGANVINGKFSYASGSEKNRYSTAMVSWSNPDNHYADEVEAVMEPDLVRRYDVRQTQISAIGCTRRTEANRRGRWALLTNAKDRMVSFDTGMEGQIPLPGYIIGVADHDLSGRIMGGRISQVNGRVLTLDRAPDAKAGDRLIVNLPSGKSQSRTIQAVSGRNVTVSAAFSETPEREAVWSVDAQDVAIQQYRVTSVEDNNDGTWTISAVQHNPDKYAAIDSGARLDERPISAIPPGVQAPPEAVTLTSYSRVVQNLSVETLRVSWTAAPGAVAYECQWRKDNGDWVNVPRTSSLGFEVQGIYAGRYMARVSAVNASDVASVWQNSEEVTLTGKVGQPPVPVNFRTMSINWGIQIDWNFPDGADDTLMTEIQYATAADGSDALLLSDVPYPAHSYTQLGLRAGQIFWYRARLVDRIGNQSAWTDWVRGMANDNAEDYLRDIADDFMTKEDGEALLSQITLDPEAILQNALNGHDTVRQQWKQYGKNRAGIMQAQTLAADANKSVAALETTVNAKFEGFEATASRLEQATADNTSAISEINDTVVAKFGEVAAAVEGKMDAYVDASGGSAIYTMKTGVQYKGKYYDAGMSVAVTINGAQVDTRFAVNANQFVVMSGSGDNRYSPFAVSNGQVFMNSTFIQDGTITNAKIGAVIQANNYAAGKTGWMINKSGAAEFNNVTVRGTIVATEGRFSMTGAGNTVVINGNGVTVNLANGGRIILGTW